jgi:hypothetical protein
LNLSPVTAELAKQGLFNPKRMRKEVYAKWKDSAHRSTNQKCDWKADMPNNGHPAAKFPVLACSDEMQCRYCVASLDRTPKEKLGNC